MARRHSKNEILDAALDVAFEGGLSQLSFGRVAKHLGIADRTVVYYFPSKDDLVGEVIMALGLRLQASLEPAFAASAVGHSTLVRQAWPVLATDETDPVFALFFEANGLAAAGREPYRTLVPALVDAWVAWTVERLDGDDEAAKREQALAAIAVIDGLLLLRLLVGADAADAAAARLGAA